jgi:DNA-binding transcriptional LysR family regulator
MQFTFRQLEVFLTIAKTGNLTKAAEELYLSQSAASSALKDLERQLNVLLFDRIGKKLQLSDVGTQLRPRVEGLMAEASDIENSLLKNEDLSQIKIGATMTVGSSLTIQMVSEYIDLYPASKVSLELNNTEKIVEQVLNYEADMGMIEGEVNNPRLTVKPWRDDHLNLFCSPDHELASKEGLSEDDLLNAKWVLRETGSGTRQTFDRAMHGLIPKLNIMLELQDTDAIKRAVRHNIGISCLSTLSINEEVERGDLVELPFTKRNFNRKFYLIMHNQKKITPSLKRWLDLCDVWTDKS